MGITNQQIADLLARLAKQTAANTAAFTATVERLIANDNRHHEAFRNRLEDLTLAQAVLKGDIQRNTEYRRQIGKYIFIVILVPVGTLLFQLIFK